MSRPMAVIQAQCKCLLRQIRTTAGSYREADWSTFVRKCSCLTLQGFVFAWLVLTGTQGHACWCVTVVVCQIDGGALHTGWPATRVVLNVGRGVDPEGGGGVRDSIPHNNKPHQCIQRCLCVDFQLWWLFVVSHSATKKQLAR